MKLRPVCMLLFFSAATLATPSVAAPPQPPKNLPKPGITKNGEPELPEVKQWEGRPPGYFDRSMPIVKHPPRVGVPIPPNSPSLGLSTGLKRQDSRYLRSEDNKYTFARLPACSMREIRRQEVFHYSPMADLWDIVFFDGTDQGEVRTADYTLGNKIIARGVKYFGGQPLAISDPKFTEWLRMAPTFGIWCLPTRVRILTDGGKRFIEFRTGKAAWEETPLDAENRLLLKRAGIFGNAAAAQSE